jgi:anthranilate phosphoribosyltransferase
MIKEIIKKVVEGVSLSEQEMYHAMNLIMEGRATDAQIAALITALRMKGETVEEITGAAKSMKHKAVSVPVATGWDLVDIVGTGGAMLNTFNISTASAFVVSGAGIKVAKHGNRSVSSSCGSADVLEKLGINIDISADSVGRCIDEVGIGFLYARNLHPAMKHAAKPRAETGIRSIFNILGPLTNPADAGFLVLGVYEERLTRLLAGVLKNLGAKRAIVVHGTDGLDEITICAKTKVSELKDGNVRDYMIDPLNYGLSLASLDDILGNSPVTNAQIISDVLSAKKGPQRDIVIINAGAAIMITGAADTLTDGMKKASESLDSGNALNKLNSLKEITQKL